MSGVESKDPGSCVQLHRLVDSKSERICRKRETQVWWQNGSLVGVVVSRDHLCAVRLTAHSSSFQRYLVHLPQRSAQ